jgi:hypothetical protein
MYELSPDECTLGTCGANPGRRKTAAQEARGACTSAVTSGPATTPIQIGASGSQFLRGWRLQPSEPFIENLKLGTA